MRTLVVSAQNYPDDVRPGRAGLRVRLRYELDAEGAVARCTVTRPSGQPSIDAESCRILRERARFRPKGNSTHGILQFLWLGERSLQNGEVRGGPIPFELADVMTPEDYPWSAIQNRERGMVVYDASVSEEGLPQRCTVTQSSGSAVLDRHTCEILMDRGSFIPASDGAGGRREGVSRGRMVWRIPAR